MAEQKERKMPKGKKNKAQELLEVTTRAMTAKAKDKRLNIEIIKASELRSQEYIPTGNPAFDLVFGGWPRGMFSCIYGGPGCGKTSLIMQAIAHEQSLNMGIFIAESEQSFSKKWAVTHGVDLENLVMTQSTDLGSVLDAVVRIAATGKCDVIYVDSLATLSPKEMRKKGVDEDDMAIVARRLGRFFQIAPETIKKSNTAIVFVTQKRDSLDLFSGGLEQYPGGNALKHQLAMAINVRRSGKSAQRDGGAKFIQDRHKIGFASMWKAIKSKVDVTENTGVLLDFFFGSGFDNKSTVFELALGHGILEKNGPGGYKFMANDGSTYDQHGSENVLRDIRTNDGLYNQMIESIKTRCKPGNFTNPPSDVDTEYEQEAIQDEKARMESKPEDKKTEEKPAKK